MHLSDLLAGLLGGVKSGSWDQKHIGKSKCGCLMMVIGGVLDHYIRDTRSGPPTYG
jgi:hypothetical protein